MEIKAERVRPIVKEAKGEADILEKVGIGCCVLITAP